MKSIGTNIRSAVTSFALVISLGSVLWAQITMNISGNKFTGGTAQDVADGRQFRAVNSQFLTIKAPVSLPVRPNPSQLNKMERLAIHFRTTSTGASLRAVQLCSGSNCQNKLETNIRGDYSTGDVVYTRNSPYANVWVFTPPVMVSSEFSIALDITFPGIIDYGTIPAQDQEFTLVSVTAYFPDAVQMRMGKAKADVGAAIRKGASTESVAVNGATIQSAACGGDASNSDAAGEIIGGITGGMTQVALGDLILLYHPRSGAAKVFKRDADGKVHSIKCYAAGAFTPGWTHIVGTPNGILFYNNADGSAVVGRLDEFGVLTNLKSYGPGSFSRGWTTIQYTAKGIEYRNDNTGATAIGEIEADGTHITR
jgi:hypothetical protein